MLLHNWKEIRLQPLSYTYAHWDVCIAQVRIYSSDTYEDVSISIDNTKTKPAAVHEAIQSLFEGSEIIEDLVLEEPIFVQDPIIAE